MTSSINDRYSRYVAGGVTEVFPNRLGWWEREIMEKRNDDIVLVVTGKLVGRADLIASQVYNNCNLEWVVRQYNTILDDELDLAEGKVIRLPVPNRVL